MPILSRWEIGTDLRCFFENCSSLKFVAGSQLVIAVEILYKDKIPIPSFINIRKDRFNAKAKAYIELDLDSRGKMFQNLFFFQDL